MPPGLNRHYRAPAGAGWYLRGMLILGAFIGVLCLLDNGSGVPGWLFALVYYGLLVAVGIWSERLLPRLGVYESDDGLRQVHSGGSYSVEWESVARFEQSRKRPRGYVLAIHHDGRRQLLIGTAQGSRISWDGGETNDIVGELNKRLSLWQSQHASAQERDQTSLPD